MYIDNDKFSQEEFDLIRTYAKKYIGIHFSDTKKILIYSRLRSRVNELNMQSFKEYYNFLANDKTGKELVFLTNKLTTNYTYFMRENSHFTYLSQKILPELEAKNKKTKKLKVFSAGCSTGEEPYILAMYLDKYFNGKGWTIDFTASDISENVLNTARKGIYPADKAISIPPTILANYFNKIDSSHYQVNKKIRNSIKFSKINLITDSLQKLNGTDVIFCRNVMIYFDNQTKENLINKFYRINNDDSYLIISRSESLNNIKNDYVLMTPSVYKKTKEKNIGYRNSNRRII